MDAGGRRRLAWRRRGRAGSDPWLSALDCLAAASRIGTISQPLSKSARPTAGRARAHTFGQVRIGDERHRASFSDQLPRRAPEGRRLLRYEPLAGHTVLWVALREGVVSVPDELHAGDLAEFEPSNDGIEFEAQSDTE